MGTKKTLILAAGGAVAVFLVLKWARKQPRVADVGNAWNPGTGFEGPSLDPNDPRYAAAGVPAVGGLDPMSFAGAWSLPVGPLQ